MDRATLIRLQDRTSKKLLKQQIILQTTLDELEWLVSKNTDGKNTRAIKEVGIRRDRQNNSIKATEEYLNAIVAEIKGLPKK